MRASDDTVIGRVIVGKDRLRIEANSGKRADTLGARVSEACTGLLRNRERKVEEPSELAAEATASGETRAAPTPEEQALIRQYNETHYRKWLDQPAPLFDGKTPRAAAPTAKSRRLLDVALREMENRESRVPEGERFDFAGLRRELDLEP